MIPYIDYSLCTGCGACAEIHPLFFEMKDGKAWVTHYDRFEQEGNANVVRSCPFGAIFVE